ncbi:MAG: molecular chaperone TorD family protein [Dehalococcoidia bacterium]|nr:molecular chaperone TorD family protein [Dehalococcoidia bacterium]
MTPLRVEPAAPDFVTLQRAAAYELLALALAYPDDNVLEQLRDVATTAGGMLRGTPVAALCEVAVHATRPELEPAYVELCTLTSSVDCPTYESAYFGGEAQLQTMRMADISGFYRAFGVETMGTGLRPDEISVELEFMAYLCRKEVHARANKGAPRVAQTRRAQRLFLEEHLGTWAAPFGRRVASRANTTFYQLAGAALSLWIAAETAELQASPVEVTGMPVIEPLDRTNHGPEFVGRSAEVITFDDIPVI